jgi:hypothetical protein
MTLPTDINAFILMPFDDKSAKNLYEHSTIPICKEFGLEILRSDQIFSPNLVLDDIIGAIKMATIIIADITDKNPNVFYELGIAHVLKKERTIIITRDDFEAVPFDVKAFRIIQYQDSIEGKAKYEKKLKGTLETILMDRTIIYKSEFELLLNIFRSINEENHLYEFIAISQLDNTELLEKEMHFLGHNRLNNPQSGCIISTESRELIDEDTFEVFINLNYVNIVENMIILTEKGIAFVSAGPNLTPRADPILTP